MSYFVVQVHHPRPTQSAPWVVACCLLALAGCATAPRDAPAPLAEQVPHPFVTAPPAASAGTASLPPDGPDRVFVQCHVVQGNGYNWASTIGWLAGQVDLAARRAATWEAAHPGRRAAVDLGCMTGSSSGGATASLLDHLLANPSLVAPKSAGPSGGERLLTVREAREVARALIFLAMSGDFKGEMFGLGLTAVGATFGWVDRASRGAPDAVWWRAKSTPERSRRLFGRWINAAYRYQPAWFEEASGGDPYALAAFAARPAALETDGERLAGADGRMQAFSREARRIVYQRGDGRSWDEVPVSDGFCVTALAVPLLGEGPPLDLDKLRLFLTCNARTREALAAPDGLAPWLAPYEKTRERLVLASADGWGSLLNATTREPDLITPLSGRLLKPPIGLDRLAAWRDGTIRAVTLDGNWLVLGGFAEPRLQAWGALALAQRRAGHWRAQGVEATALLALFGRTEDRSDPTDSFAQRAIVQYFSAADDEDGAGEALADFYAWQDEFCEAASGAGELLQVDYYRMDWNLSGTPAAMSGRSRELAALGFNLTRLQAPPDVAASAGDGGVQVFLYTPEDLPRYAVAAPAGGMTCTDGPA